MPPVPPSGFTTADGKTPDWKDLLNKIDSGVDRCSEHSLNIRRGQPSGPGDLSVFSLFNSLNTIEVVIIISSNLGTETMYNTYFKTQSVI